MLPIDRKDRNPCRLPLFREPKRISTRFANSFRYIDRIGQSWPIFDYGSDFHRRSLHPAPNAGGPCRSLLRDHAGAWARRAGRVPQPQRLAVERRPRAAYRPVAADGVAADLHAGATRLSQARRQGTLPARARYSGRRLSGAVGAKSPATGASPDARFRRLHRRHGFHRDAVRARLHLCRNAAHHRRRDAFAGCRLCQFAGAYRRRPRAAVAVHQGRARRLCG